MLKVGCWYAGVGVERQDVGPGVARRPRACARPHRSAGVERASGATQPHMGPSMGQPCQHRHDVLITCQRLNPPHHVSHSSGAFCSPLRAVMSCTHTYCPPECQEPPHQKLSSHLSAQPGSCHQPLPDPAPRPLPSLLPFWCLASRPGGQWGWSKEQPERQTGCAAGVS